MSLSKILRIIPNGGYYLSNTSLDQKCAYFASGKYEKNLIK